MKVRKIFVLTCVVALMCSLVACNKEVGSEEIFILTGSNGVDGDRESFKGLIRDGNDYGLYMLPNKVKDSEVDKIKNIKGSKEGEYQYEYSEEYTKKLDSDKVERIFDMYFKRVDDNGEEKVIEQCRYLRDTEFICTYFSFQENVGIYKGEGDTRGIAEEYLVKILSKEGFEEYTHTETRSVEYRNKTLYRYTRFIEGYKTNDEITIYVDEDGYVASYYIWEYGKYDTLKNSLTKEQLDKTKEKLDAKIAEVFAGQDIELRDLLVITDPEAKPYLEITIVEDTCAYTLATPIE